jgi:hypothetical protein
VINNMIVSIEQHVDWIADCLAHLRSQGFAAIEATSDAEDVGDPRQRRGPCHALPHRQFLVHGGEYSGKPRVFMPYVGETGPTGSAATTSRRRGRGFHPDIREVVAMRLAHAAVIGKRCLVAVVVSVVLFRAVAPSAAQDKIVRLQGRVQWIAGQKMMLIPDNGSLPIEIDIQQVPQDDYRTLGRATPSP